jgi:glutaminyl-peptide cyclotransferase
MARSSARKRSRRATPRPAARRPASRSLWRDARVPILVLVLVGFLAAVWFTGFALSDKKAGTEVRLGSTQRFSGETAFERLKEQCAFGPRVPGTDGHRKCLEYLVAALKPLASRVEEQSFSFQDGTRQIRMTNIIARFPGTGSEAPGSGVLLAAHWDTRPTADQDPDPAQQRRPILGANDGASGVAVLLEAAKMLKAKKPTVPVWIVLFDGEDYGPGLDRMFLGARHFADHLPQGVPRRGVLLDMIGDRNLEVFKEVNSSLRAGAVVDSVWATAQRLGYQAQFNPATKYTISDDHLPLLDKGIAMIDVIDFDYPPWHTQGDTVDKCSAASLQTIGDVVVAWVYDQRS